MECFDHAGTGMYGKLLFPISDYHFLIHMEATHVMGIAEIEFRFYYRFYPGKVLEIVSGSPGSDDDWRYAPIGRFRLKEAFYKDMLPSYLQLFMLESRTWLGLGWVYHESPVISKERFEYIKDDIMADLRIVEYNTMQKWGNNSLVLFCQKAGLDIHPTPENGYLDCKCPAGNHRFTLDAAKSRWWCGYCRKKGGINELSDQVEIWRTKHG